MYINIYKPKCIYTYGYTPKGAGWKTWDGLAISLKVLRFAMQKYSVAQRTVQNMAVIAQPPASTQLCQANGSFFTQLSRRTCFKMAGCQTSL